MRLPAVEKRYLNTMVGGPGGRARRECWSATTTDGVWSIERQEAPGTPWLIFHHPSGKTAGYAGSLRKALIEIADGTAERALNRKADA